MGILLGNFTLFRNYTAHIGKDLVRIANSASFYICGT